LFTGLYSALLDSTIVAFCKYFGNDSIIGSLNHSRRHSGALVGSAPPNLNMK